MLSWRIALERGYERRLYPYATPYVPVGTYEAVLDFKIWARKAMAICCYFTQRGTGVKFQLTVYRRAEDKSYRLEEGDVDFRVCPVDNVYTIKVIRSGNQQAAFQYAAANWIEALVAKTYCVWQSIKYLTLGLTVQGSICRLL